MSKTAVDLNKLKLSALIRLAVRDVKSVSKSRNYVLEMSSWHMPIGDGKCGVCMAGAVMARTLKVDRGEYLVPEDSGAEKPLLAINAVRLGHVLSAQQLYIHLGQDISEKQYAALDRAGTLIKKSMYYDKDRAPWHVYLRAARMLSRVGL